MSERGYGGPFLALREAALTMTPPEFLLARIAEDEADARVELERFIRDHGPAELVDTTWAHPYMDPRRVLAECEAKRQIVADFTLADADYRVTRSEADEVRRLAALLAVTRVAAVFADHPDYREEWKP